MRIAGLAKWRPYQVRRLRRRVERAGAAVCLHLGCGEVYLNGWINVDVAGGDPVPDVILDLRRGLPLPDQCADLIFSEDVLEHLDLASGRRLLVDCHRVLRPGGVMRLVTPNLRSFAQAYLDRDEATLAWYRAELGCESFAEMLNAGLRAWGHQFLHDADSLTDRLKQIGFDPRRRQFQSSDEQRLRGLDRRNADEGAHSMYFDCYKAD